MSSLRPGRQHVIRRRPRKAQYVELPELEPVGEAPHAGQHAKVFAVAFVALVLVAGVLLSTPLTTESGASTPIVDALFTAVSAAAVTGLVTVETQEHWNFFGELVVLLLIQAGGIGFMVGASLILLTLRRGQTRLSDAMLMQNGAPTLSLKEATVLSKRIIRFIVIVEAIGAVLLAARFAQDMPLDSAIWHGVFHSISAFCNAGFDLQGGYRSLAGYDTSIWLCGVIMLLIQLGALSYVALEDVVRQRRWHRFALDTKLVLIANGILVVGGAIFFLIAEWERSLAGMPDAYKPLGSLFQSIAARTAGFATVGFGDLRSATVFVWIGVMMVGGASGSTAGGVKLSTVGVVIAAVFSTLRGRDEVQMFSRRVTTPLIFRAISVIVLFVIAHFTITLLMVVSEDLFGGADVTFLSMMFEAMSALATVGLTTGITPALTDGSKIALMLAMFIGRLGPLTAAYALQRRQRPVRYRFPVAPVRIG